MTSSRLDGPAPPHLLASVFQTYRRGLLRVPAASYSLPLHTFNVLCFLGTLGWMCGEDRLQLHELHGHCARGLAAARAALMQQAAHHYRLAEAQLENLHNGGSRASCLLGASAYWSGIAYLHYREGREGMACKGLDRSMDAALELEERGLPVMLLHRIQQGHNLARMDIRRGRRESAIKGAGSLVAYIEGQLDRLPFHRCWPAVASAALPRQLLRSMLHQVLGETACVIATGEASTEEWRALLAAARPSSDPDRAVYPQLQYALHAQRDLLALDFEGYLRSLERFFSFGIQRCHLVWYALMIELIVFCSKAVDLDDYGRVRAALLRDSRKWRSVPTALRERLDALVTEVPRDEERPSVWPQVSEAVKIAP